jgi:hypothetical protein
MYISALYQIGTFLLFFLNTAVSILGGVMGGFTHIFENSPLFFQRQGEILHRERRKKSTNVKNSHFSTKIPPVFQILE